MRPQNANLVAPPVLISDEIQVPFILGRYRIDSRIGHGGMGVVYAATHVALNRKVAIKILKPKLAADSQFVSRFQREVAALGKVLNNSHVILATDAGEESGVPFLAMEFVEGENLDQLLAHSREPLSPGFACELIRQAALGLDAIHQQKLVHRDLKPTNLMLTPECVLKILDLGLARWHDDEMTHSDLTPERGILGTLDYQAPEQASDPRRVDIRADIYSLGCTLFKLLTGRTPYAEWSHYDKITAHATASIPPLPDAIPAEIRGIVIKMMAKKPADRFQTPAELAAALAEVSAAAKGEVVVSPASGQQGKTLETIETRSPTTSPINNGSTPASAVRIPERPSRAFPWRMTFALITCLAVLGVAVPLTPMFRNRGQRESARRDLNELPLLTTFLLLEQAPIKALWDNRLGLATFQHDPKQRLLAVTLPAGENALLLFGDVSVPSYELQIRLFQPEWRPGVGVVLGYRKLEIPRPCHNGVVVAEFQMIHLAETVKDPNLEDMELRMMRSQCEHVRFTNGKEAVHRRELYSEVLTPIFNERAMNLRVKNRQIDEVRIDQGNSLQALMTPDARKSFGADWHQGGVGLWICGTTATFRDFGFRVLER